MKRVDDKIREGVRQMLIASKNSNYTIDEALDKIFELFGRWINCVLMKNKKNLKERRNENESWYE